MLPLCSSILSAAILSMSSASFGISLVSANPLKTRFPDDGQFTLVVAMVYFGAIFSNFFARRLRMGERSKLFLANVLFVAGYLCLLYDTGINAAAASRFMLGLGVGIVNAVVPLYLSRISPEGIKGILTSMNTLGSTGGIVFGHYLSVFHSYSTVYKTIIGYTVVHSALLLLVQRSDHIPSLLPASVIDLFKSHRARNGLLVASALHIGQHFSGVNYMIIFIDRLFADKLAPIKFNSVAVLVTFFSGFLLNYFGKKPMVVFSCLSVVLALGILLTEKANSMAAILYFAGFNCGLNSVPWSVVDEVFEESHTDAGSLMSVALNYLCAFITIAGVPALQGLMGTLSALFYIVCTLALVVVILLFYNPANAKRMAPVN